jgi:hypothetical protein
MPHRPPNRKKQRRLQAFEDLIAESERFRFQGIPMRRLGYYPDLTLGEIMDYRIIHPSQAVQDIIARALSRRAVIDAGEADIRVDPLAGASLLHHELFICAACLYVLELQDACLWKEKGFPPEECGQTDGWLLVEQRQIIGGAKFSRIDDIWMWQFAWIHPEHRRKGYLLKRLPQWIERYGSFVADQPNQHARALLRKAGYTDKILINVAITSCRTP